MVVFACETKTPQRHPNHMFVSIFAKKLSREMTHWMYDDPKLLSIDNFAPLSIMFFDHLVFTDLYYKRKIRCTVLNIILAIMRISFCVLGSKVYFMRRYYFKYFLSVFFKIFSIRYTNLVHKIKVELVALRRK